MGDHRNSSLREFSPKNQYFNPNPNLYRNAPPPPFPPSFRPPTMPSGPRTASIPPPSHPPLPYPAQFPPPPCPPTNYPPPQHPVQPLPTHSQLPPNYPPSSYSTQPLPFTPSPSLCNRPGNTLPPWESGLQQPKRNLVNRQPLIEAQLTTDIENPQDWVNHWARNRGKSKNGVKSDVKIYTVKENLDAALKLVRELENSSRTLGVMVKTVSTAEWEQKCHEVEEKKAKLLNLFGEIKLSEADSKILKEKLAKRRKKRARLRRKSERLKIQKEEEKVKAQNVNFQIDNWQREMQEEVEKCKREEDLKKEADAVLWGVTQRKTEAKRQVAMLSALLTLRSVRVARLTAAGQPVSQSQIDTFNTVIERLKSMWSRQLEECGLEEQVLRGMLGVDDRPLTDAVLAYRRLVLQEWEMAIFGCVGSLDQSLPHNQLVDVRRSWDRFSVSEPSLLASAVPPGYVLPVPPSSDQWKSFLKY